MAREKKKKIAILLIDDETGGRQEYFPSYFKFEEKVQRVSKKPQRQLSAPLDVKFKDEYLTVVTSMTVEVMNYLYLTVS